MNEIVVIFLGIFILIIFIILFVLLYYINDNFIKYNDEVKDNLYKSEQVINDTSSAFNKLQDNVINKIAKVNSNQEDIINNNNTASGKMSTNLLNVMDIINNGVSFSNLTSNIIDPSKPLQIKLKPEILTYSNISVLTGSNYLNICDNATNSSNRKCLNINVDSGGIFNINTANNVSASNIARIAIKDISNNVMAEFDGANKRISLGSNISPAIQIEDNIYTPNIIVCTYKYINTPEVAANAATIPPTSGSSAVKQISLTLISNFDIKPSSYLNFIVPENYISSIIASQATTPVYTNPILKIKTIDPIPKNTITTFNINIAFNSTTYTQTETSAIYNTNAYITLS